MNDINFFATFAKERAQLKKKTKRTRNITLGIILVVILFYGFMGLRLLYMYISINNGEKFLNSPDIKPRIEQIEAQKLATLSMAKYNSELEKAGKKILLTDRVSTELLDKIQNAMPAAASLRLFDMDEYQLVLEGNVPVWTTTAELTHNLEASGLFRRVHVGTVTKNKDADSYYFSLLCDLKEVAAQ
jgi:type IV pilus assembly protein PilN